MRKIATEIIYQDSERTLSLTGGGFLIADGKRGRKEADLSKATTDKSLPAGSAEALRKIHENAADWYLLRTYGTPAALLPDASREAVDAAIVKAKEWAAAREAIETAELKARDDAARNACPDDYALARQNWANGDLCAAEYVTEDGVKVIASDLLESHNGWYYLPIAAVEAARARRDVATAEAAKQQAAVKAEREAKLSEAKATGKPVVLRQWVTEDCTEQLDECSFDAATEWILPDGSTKIDYTHCY